MFPIRNLFTIREKIYNNQISIKNYVKHPQHKLLNTCDQIKIKEIISDELNRKRTTLPSYVGHVNYMDGL
jgi:hypothetical protein